MYLLEMIDYRSRMPGKPAYLRVLNVAGRRNTGNSGGFVEVRFAQGARVYASRKSCLKTYLINLSRRPDRLRAMSDQFTALGIPFERIDAIDARTTPDAEIDTRFADDGPLGPLPKGDKCCTLSHERAWATFIASGEPYAMIMEDDVEISPDAAPLLTDTTWIPAEVGLLKVERFGPEHQRVLVDDTVDLPNGRQIGKLRSRHTGGGAYIVSRAMAQKMLDPQRVWTLPVDHALFNPNNSPLFEALVPYQLLPVIARQSVALGGTTDIDEWRTRFRRMTFGLLRRKAIRAYYDVRLLPRQLVSLALGRGKLVRVEQPRPH
jgi:glycosyl transferase family 25